MTQAPGPGEQKPVIGRRAAQGQAGAFFAALLLLVLVAGVVRVSLQRALPELGWPDEWIYLTQARTIVTKGTLNTNFYIASSIEKIGYPHRDVHLPGYVLALAAVSPWRGFSFETAVALNVACFGVTVISAFLLALRFFSLERSLVAAALVAISPPYPGYLAIAYPEHVTAAALMLLVTAAVWIRGHGATVLLGFALGVCLLFRETLLFATPLLIHRLGIKRALRFFFPGLLLAMVTVLPPLSANRAIHPNALYPSAVAEALSSPEPVGRLMSTIMENAKINLDLLITSDPRQRAEDAVLLFLLALGLLAFVVSFKLNAQERSFVRAALVSTVLLFAAMVVVYVVRERGGVWGGVRALMPMAPLFIVGACGLKLGRVPSGIFVTAFFSLSLFLNSWQIAFFNRYKATNLEDQDRAATFIEARTRQFSPRRVAGGRYFQYGFRNFPAEVIWSGADTMANLNRLHTKAPFDFVVIHRSSLMRFELRADPRYEWLNADEGQGAEYQIYRRVSP